MGDVLKRKAADDVHTLFGHLGIDPNAYRKFARSVLKKPEPVAADAPAGTNQPEPTSGKQPVARPAEKQGKQIKALVADAKEHSEAKPLDVPFRWRALRDTTELDLRLIQQQQIIGPPALALYSVAGGCGITTILATLSRALSTKHEQVLAADCSEWSTLALYFGGSNFADGLNTILLPDAAPLHLRISRSAEEGGAVVGDREDAWLWEAIDQLGSRVHRVLLEAPGEVSSRTERWLSQSAVSLIVMVPDMRCVIGLRRLLAEFQAREDRLGLSIPRYFLLNKFDPSSRLNVDMRKWFSDQLGDSLLPIVLRRDERIAEALAQGQTILDYAPDSEAVEDFLQLIDWVRGPKC